MSSYMDEFGAADRSREKLRNRLLIGLLITAILGGGLYYRFRNYREDGQVARFVQLLKDKQYVEAYQMWGCTDSKPCPSYPMETFQRDWGPDSDHAALELMKLGEKKSCTSGVIQKLDFPKDSVYLWVNRADQTLGFAPWKVCNPRATVGSLR